MEEKCTHRTIIPINGSARLMMEKSYLLPLIITSLNSEMANLRAAGFTLCGRKADKKVEFQF
jgi:hypothetical protein